MAGQQRQGVSPERIVEVALGILESDGPEGLTMRRLASKLGVAVTAIYWHVGDKQALLDAVVDRIAAEVGEVPVTGEDPVARIVSMGRSLRHNLLARPHLVGLVHQRGRTAVMFQPARRVLVRELTAAGLRGQDAALAVHTILWFVSGSVLNVIQVERSPEQHPPAEELWTADDVRDAPDLLEHLARPIDPDDLFDYSLGALVHALVKRGTSH
jgi:TetR/AcrR family tetracycline transcriptional repressor